MALSTKLIGWLLVVSLPAGCGMKVTTDFDESVDFSRLRTFDWAPREQSATSDPRLENSLLTSRIRRAVERQLSAMGYRKAATGDPDFLVAHLVTTQTVFPPSFKDAGWQSGLPTEVDQYEEGTLILDLIDPSGMRLIWRGTATTPLDESAGPREREATIDEAVHSILKRFPPEQK